MSRSVKEWVAKTDDAKVPPRVRLRVFQKHDGVCHISGIRIAAGMLWDIDHVVALTNGGQHRESNLAPALRDKHKAKTAADVAEKSRVMAKAKANIGIKPAKARIPAPAKPAPKPRRFDRTPLPPRPLYVKGSEA